MYIRKNFLPLRGWGIDDWRARGGVHAGLGGMRNRRFCQTRGFTDRAVEDIKCMEYQTAKHYV